MSFQTEFSIWYKTLELYFTLHNSDYRSIYMYLNEYRFPFHFHDAMIRQIWLLSHRYNICVIISYETGLSLFPVENVQLSPSYLGFYTSFCDRISIDVMLNGWLTRQTIPSANIWDVLYMCNCNKQNVHMEQNETIFI